MFCLLFHPVQNISMTIIPQQFFGAGDAVWIQSLLKQLCEPGDKILYPILQQFVEGFNRAYPDVTFIDYKLLNIDYEKRTEVRTLTSRILPIRFADQILNRPYNECMRAKYDLYGLDWMTWRDVMYERDMKREWELSKQFDVIGDAPIFTPDGKMTIEPLWHLPRVGTPYNLISPYYGSGSQYKVNIEPDNGLPNIYMSSVPGYSLFDWSLLAENATEIHAVSSSIIYLLELLNFTGKAHLYPREAIEPKTWYENISYLLTKDYVIHQ